jgi:hypothetical protein
MPVFVTWSTLTFRPSRTRSRSWLTSSGVASTERLPLARSPINLLDCAARRFAGLSTFLARLLEPRSLEAKTIRCSAALLGKSSTASRFAHQIPQGNPGTASRDRKIPLPAPLPGWPEKNRSPSHSCRRRSDLWSPAASSCRCRLLERPGPPSRSPLHHAHIRRVAKAKNARLALWKTGISGTIAGTFSDPPIGSRFGCRFVPLRLIPPSA